MQPDTVRRMPPRPAAPARAVLLLLVAACSSEPPPQVASLALLDGLPVAPASARVESGAGAEAVEARYRSGLPADSVAAWYRRWFLAERWQVNGDARLPDGATVLHAEREGRPVWIVVRPGGAGAGSTFSLMGAEPGQEPAPAPAPR
jgi:hypothetical protein